jgi:SAM-dependent methyltransferase
MSNERACPFCSETQSGLVDHHTDAGINYDLYHCGSCGAEFWEPMRNPGAEWYEHDERYANRNLDPILKPNKKHQDTISFFGEKTGKVLDVGCGIGNFLALAKEKGWDCWGIDFDRDSILTARETFGLENMEAVDLSTFRATHPDERFDLVSFFDVFEHIDNHVEFISQVRSSLKPNGYLALSVPYRHAWRWLIPNDLPPRHLTRWDDKALGNFLKRNGFTVSKVWKLPASWDFLVMKLRWKYGGFARFGLVKAAKQKERQQIAKDDQKAERKGYSNSIKVLHFLAKTKDIVLFGIPAGLLWLVLYFSDKRHTDFYLVAQMDHE